MKVSDLGNLERAVTGAIRSVGVEVGIDLSDFAAKTFMGSDPAYLVMNPEHNPLVTEAVDGRTLLVVYQTKEHAVAAASEHKGKITVMSMTDCVDYASMRQMGVFVYFSDGAMGELLYTGTVEDDSQGEFRTSDRDD